MKKYVIFFLLLVPFLGKATVFVSSVAGGSWNGATTWSGTTKHPGFKDTVSITNGAIITVNGSDSVYSMAIGSGSTLAVTTSGVTLYVYHSISNNGTISEGTNTTVVFRGSINQVLTGTTGTTDIYNFTSSSADTVALGMAVTVHNNLTISSGALYCGAPMTGGSGTLTMTSGTTLLLGVKNSVTNISFPTFSGAISLSTASTVIYESSGSSQTISTTPTYGNLTLLANNPIDNKTFSSGTLTVKGNLLISLCTFTPLASINLAGSFLNNGGIFTPGTSTVTFNGSSAQTLGGTSPSTFYNLTANGGNTVTLGNFETVFNTFTIGAGTTFDVSVSNYGLTVDGNFTSSGTFTCRSGIVTMNGTANQTITGPSGGLTLNNLIIAPIVSTDTIYLNPSTTFTFTLNSNLSITNGAFGTQTNVVSSSGTLAMAMGTTLLLGSKSSSTPISLPGFSVTSFNPTSTVIYQTKGTSTQTVAPAPVYGNLILSSATTGATKTASGSVDVAGNLTIGSTVTFSVTGTKVTIGGNFIDNGTYTASDTILFNGSSVQTISGTSHPTYDNIIVSGGASRTVSLGYNTTISNKLSITSGTLDATASNYNLTIGGSFTASGGAFNPHGDSVSMTGSSPSLGGSSLLNLNKLTIGNGGTTNLSLGGNITLTSNMTINGNATLNTSSNTITIAGNFTDDGTFNCNTGTVDFDNSGNQCVTGTHTSETFQNLTIGPLSKLGTSCTVNIDGTIFIQPGGQMLCACH